MNEVYAGKHHFILYQTTQISIHNFSNNVTIMDKIFETNPSFHVQYSATEKVQFLFSSKLLLILSKFSF